MPLRLVMMGTGSFALPTFLALYGTNHKIVGLFTQPDRTGRGHHHHVNPLKNAAVERGTPVFQPDSANDDEALKDLRALDADLCVVAAYGQILSAELLEIPRLGAINIHASLLPKYRGAAPVQYSILKGETETGVTIFQIDPRLDAGPILGIEKTDIGPKETAGELENRLAEIAVGLTLNVVDQIGSGTTSQIPQDPSKVSRAPRIRKEQGAVDWSKSAEEIGCHVRAMQPWPNPYTFLEQEGHSPLRLILLKVETAGATDDAEPGTIIHADGKHLVVQAGKGVVKIMRLKPEGKRVMTAAEFMHGHHIRIGSRLRPSTSR